MNNCIDQLIAKSMSTNKILSLIRGELIGDERSNLLKDINTHSEKKKLFIDLKHIFSMTHKNEGIIDVDREYRLIQSRMKNNVRKLWVKNVMKYAAVLIVGFGLSWLAFHQIGESNTFTHEIKSPSGQFTECTLGDGTTVFLNSNSTIKYDSKFGEKHRTLILNGEGFFKVTKNSSKPFIIETLNGAKIRVLGTTFNLSAYSDDPEVTTTLIEGKVEILDIDNEVLTALNPNQTAIYNNANHDVLVKKSNTQLFTSWQDGKIYFENEPLEAIARKMARWYNVSIIIKDNDLRKVPFTLTVLKNKPLYQILEALKLTSPIDYSIEEKLDDKNIITLKKELPMGK